MTDKNDKSKHRRNTDQGKVPPIEDGRLTNNERRIVKQLIERPNIKNYKELSLTTSVKYGTVLDNVDRLEKKGYLSHIWKVNFAAIGYEIAYRIDVVLDPFKIAVDVDKNGIPTVNPQEVLALAIRDLVEQKPFKERVLVENVEILLGNPADLSITVRAASHEYAFDFVTRGLRSLPGIRGTSTCQIAWSLHGLGPERE